MFKKSFNKKLKKSLKKKFKKNKTKNVKNNNRKSLKIEGGAAAYEDNEPLSNKERIKVKAIKLVNELDPTESNDELWSHYGTSWPHYGIYQGIISLFKDIADSRIFHNKDQKGKVISIFDRELNPAINKANTSFVDYQEHYRKWEKKFRDRDNENNLKTSESVLKEAINKVLDIIAKRELTPEQQEIRLKKKKVQEEERLKLLSRLTTESKPEPVPEPVI